MRLFVGLLLFSSSVLLHGCAKEKLKVHVVNVQCYDSVTGEPFQGEIALWRTNGIPDPSNNPPVFVKSVITDVNGHGQIDFEVLNDRKHYINVSRTFLNGIGSPFYSDSRFNKWQMQIDTDLSNTNLVVELDRYYSFQLTTINTNCTGPTDSLWIATSDTWKNNYEVTGCDEANFTNMIFSGRIISNVNQLTFNVTTKKSGVVNTFSVTHDLTLGTTPDQIVIEY